MLGLIGSEISDPTLASTTAALVSDRPRFTIVKLLAACHRRTEKPISASVYHTRNPKITILKLAERRPAITRAYCSAVLEKMQLGVLMICAFPYLKNGENVIRNEQE